MSKTIIIIVSVLGVIGIGIFALNYEKVPRAEDGGPLSSSVVGDPSVLPTEDAVASDKFLTTLLNMKNIKFDEGIFSNPSFLALKDFTTPLVPEGNEGRLNPFAPVGQDAAIPVAQTFSVTTLPPVTLTSTGAVLTAQISGGAIAQERYFEYGTQNVTPLPNVTTRVQQSVTTGQFTFPLTALTPNTTYYVRGVAKIGGVTYYGTVINFKTTAQ